MAAWCWLDIVDDPEASLVLKKNVSATSIQEGVWKGMLRSMWIESI